MPKIAEVSEQELAKLMNEEIYQLWKEIKVLILENYELNQNWYTGGKQASYELKFQKSGRTLLSLFPKEQEIGVMIIFGKNEREKIEQLREKLPEELMVVYDEAKVYHDGKWVMWTLPNPYLLPHLIQLLSTKRKPNKK